MWLMRQAGRFLPEFRDLASKQPFRARSETASLALELSLMPYHRFKPDGVIFFSDILTPLPALGPSLSRARSLPNHLHVLSWHIRCRH